MVARVRLEPGVYSTSTLAAIAAMSSPMFRAKMESLNIKPLRSIKTGAKIFAQYGEDAHAWASSRRAELVAAHQAEKAAMEAKRQAVSDRIAKAQKNAEQLKLDFAGHKQLDAVLKEEDKMKLRKRRKTADNTPTLSTVDALMEQNKETIEVMRAHTAAVNAAADKIVSAINMLVHAWKE